MRIRIILLLLSFVTSSFSQNEVFIDEYGNSLESSEFYRKWKDQIRWDYIVNDSLRYAKVYGNRILTGTANYHNIKIELEKIINRSIPKNKILIISYHFKDDLCDSTAKNKWYRIKINNVKRQINKHLKELDRNDIFFIALFENGMRIKTKKKSKNETFFIDRKDFFKNIIFSQPSLCGATASITSNGEILVINGEGSIYKTIKSLNADNWNKYFPEN